MSWNVEKSDGMAAKLLNAEQVQLLVTGGENVSVEFKRRAPHDEDLARVLAAFANTKGGILIIGVDDRGEFAGLTPEEAAIAEERVKRVARSIMPDRLEQVTRASIDRRILVFAEVRPPRPDDVPVITASGKLFRRDQSNNVIDEHGFNAFGAALLEGTPLPNPGRIKMFVAMSFRTEEEPALVDYYGAMKRAADRSRQDIDFVRIDICEGDYEISQEVMRQIDAVDAVLCDFTLSPHNVYFEAGYARGRGKTIVQTARARTDLEFDVRNWRTLFYKNATELEESLVRAFDALGVA
jgi:nucleoside 2-deoxyribosyltransferase